MVVTKAMAVWWPVAGRVGGKMKRPWAVASGPIRDHAWPDDAYGHGPAYVPMAARGTSMLGHGRGQMRHQIIMCVRTSRN